MSVTKYAADWMRRGDEDLVVCDILLEEKGPLSAACFHAQQAAEKYLKGWLAAHAMHIRKSHDLAELLNACLAFDQTLEEVRTSIEVLNIYYLPTRYPGNYPEVVRAAEAEAAVKASKAVVDAVKQRLRGVA